MELILAIPRMIKDIIVIAWLLTRIAILEAKILRLRMRIAELERVIDQFTAKCRQAAESSAREMERGNVPQGRYGYLKGVNDFANSLLRLLGRPERKPVKRGAGLFGGMFKW